jgi:heparosan-N-sulfate-glucuronate 5-epimerase
VLGRLRYWRRIAQAYVLPGPSPLDFWHETPEAHPKAVFDELGPYYMTFAGKAAYAGPFDDRGVPLLDYRGDIGRRYNPIAVAQYGLAHYNRSLDGDETSKGVFLAQASWLADNLEKNAQGVPVWRHHFDFEYRTLLRAPWQSGLAQGMGLSLLTRAYMATGETKYLDALRAAWKAFHLQASQGGVVYREPTGNVWIEEYLVQPPSHILNGFIWALWGVLDFHLVTADRPAKELFDECVKTLERNLHRYDSGRWSLYELGDARLPMVASSYYHRLHIVQLRVLHAMTGAAAFKERADRWEAYAALRSNRVRSRVQKVIFKLLYY